MTSPDITKAAEELASAILKAAGSDLKHYTTQKRRDEIIGAAVNGLEAERENCAKIADEQSSEWRNALTSGGTRNIDYANGRSHGADVIAAAIPKGGE